MPERMSIVVNVGGTRYYGELTAGSAAAQKVDGSPPQTYGRPAPEPRSSTRARSNGHEEDDDLATNPAAIRAIEPLGQKIRRRRQRLAMTLGEVSDASGVSKPYLSLIENDKLRNAPSEMMVSLLEPVLRFASGEWSARSA